MNEQKFIEYLQHFGLTRQEAVVYQKLLVNGKQTGYEISKETGVSRSNVYNALAALVDKGAAYQLEEAAKKYIPVKLEEFCENCIRQMTEEKEWLLLNLPRKKIEEEGYITIEGAENIRSKIHNLLCVAQERVYISCKVDYIQEFSKELRKLIEQNKKVVIITDEEITFPGALIYVSEDKGSQIGMITDSRYVITGEYGDGSMNTCLYSGQHNFVILFKNALANEIKLIQMKINAENIQEQ